MSREELSKHSTYEGASEAKSKHEVQDALQIRRTSSGFKLVRRTASGIVEKQGETKLSRRRRSRSVIE